ncbi:unnamed protein product [Closterium sp. NIES-54]
MESELKSIEENGTWELVELPEGRKVITSKWLFKIKSDADGKIERYKSRLVAKGYQQKEKVDYKELFAPVVKPTTFRTLLAGAAIKGWVVKQMDVTTAFLNGVLEEEIFMAQPEGFDDGSGRVVRLKKALYGVKQAPRQWYLKLRGVLEEIGFTPSSAAHSLFMLGEGEQRSFMVVYVDDILIFSPSSDLVKYCSGSVTLRGNKKSKSWKSYRAGGSGGARTGGTGAAGTGGVVGAGAGDPTESGAAGVGGSIAGGTSNGAGGAEAGSTGTGGAGAGGARAGGTGAGGTGAGGARAVDPGAEGARVRVLGDPSFPSLTPPLLCPSPDQSQLPLQPASTLHSPSPYIEQSGGLTKRREPVSRPVLPVFPARRVPHSRHPPVPGTHAMALRPFSVPLRVTLLPLESSLPAVRDPDLTFYVLPVLLSLVSLLLLSLTLLLRPLFQSDSASPPSVGGECALGTDVLEDKQEDFEYLADAVPRFASMLLALEGDPDAPDIPTPRSYAEVITGPYSSQYQAAMDAEMASWKSTGTYVDAVPPSRANIVDSMWIFRVKRPPGSPPAFKASYVSRGFNQGHGVDYFQTFSPTPKMTTLRVLLHVTAQRDYELHSLDFNTAFLQGSLHEEIWLRRPPGFTRSFPAGTQWSLRRPDYGLRQAPREWHVTLRTTLAALGFAPSTADPSLFLSTNTTLPPFYVLVYVEDLVIATADTEALILVNLELQNRHTCTDLGELRSYLGLQITRDKARRTITVTQSHMVHQVFQRFGFQFSSPQPTPLCTSQSL